MQYNLEKLKIKTICSLLVLTSYGQIAYSSTLSSALKRIAKVADEVPIRNLDEIVQNKSTRDVAADVIRRTSGKVDDLADPIVLNRLLRQSLKNVDPAIIRQIDQLDIPAKQAALVLGRGADNVGRALPDVALRSEFVSKAGAETLLTLGQYDDLVEDALKFDAVANSGIWKNGPRVMQVSDFGNFFNKNGERAHHFWSKYIRPNWKAVSASTALAVIMVSPDEYLDAAGDFTKQGLTKLGHASGVFLGGAIAGTGDGIKVLLNDTATAVYETYLKSFLGVVSLLILFVVTVFTVPYSRRIIVSNVIGRLHNKSESPKENQG